VNYINDEIDDVVMQDDVHIHNLTTKSGKTLYADIFIDASGLNRTLMQNRTFIHAESMPMDRALPMLVLNKSDDIPPYTHALAHEAGWMWEIPIGQRFGTGFVYSSKYMSDEDAKRKYAKMIFERHGAVIKPNRIIEFNAGYYHSPWQGNVVPVGLASGFLEPLEATNIHMMISQVRAFVAHWKGMDAPEISKEVYNRKMETMWEQAIGFVRMHYETKRTEPMWKDLRESTPSDIRKIKEACQKGFFTSNEVPYLQDEWNVFGYSSYAKVLFGKGWLNKQKAEEFLRLNNCYEDGEQRSKYFDALKQEMYSGLVEHKMFLDVLRNL
jgi:tryptophan halogenase